jgi:hypothetical protein
MRHATPRPFAPALVLLALVIGPAGSSAAEPPARAPSWDMSMQELQAIGLGQSRGEPRPVPADAPKTNAPADEQSAIEPKAAMPGTIFVNFDGATLNSGWDDATTNTTQMNEFVGTFAPYGNDMTKRQAVLEAVRQDWAEYDMTVTDVRPASGQYTMNMTGPTNPFGGGVLGIAPVDCNDEQTHSNITFAFHSAGDQFSPAITATTIGQEVAHSYGLEHVDEPGDIMNPYNAGGDPIFNDACINIVQNIYCPNQHQAVCGSAYQQNAHQELLNLFGPAIADMGPPTVSISYPADGDTFEPGANFEVTVDAADDKGIDRVQLFNNGTALESDASEPYGWGVSNIPEGEYVLHVIATDQAGNEAMSNVVTIYVGSEPPAMGDESGGGDGDDGGGSADDGGDGADDGDTDALPPGLDDTGDEGCGCRTTPRGDLLSLMGLGLLGFALRRRR